MKVLLLSTYFHATHGGASVAAYRLHQGLRRAGIDSEMLIQRINVVESYMKGVENKVYRISAGLGMLRLADTTWILRLYRNRQSTAWDIGWLPTPALHQVNRLAPDLIHMHWINDGFIPVRALSHFKRPVVWTLHDSWAFTGGCHFPQTCIRYRESCGCCPQLASRANHDLSYWTLRAKQRRWQEVDLTIVTPSRWLADCARASSLFRDRRVEVIPNGLDLDVFSPLDRSFARQVLGLPHDKKLILFGAVNSTSDPRKGFQFLRAAIQKLASAGAMEGVELMILGNAKTANDSDLGVTTHYLGSFHDQISLRLVYSAADVFVAPSLQENLPNMVMEAMACGIPCVAFNIGGLPDMIEHQQNGYLARPYESDDLATGIAWVLADNPRLEKLSQLARRKVENEFALPIVTERYINLYQELSAS